MRGLLALFLVMFSAMVLAGKNVSELTDLAKCSIIADGYARMYQNHVDGWSIGDQKEFLDNVLGNDDVETLNRLKREAENIYKLPVPLIFEDQKREKIDLYIRESANCLYDF